MANKRNHEWPLASVVDGFFTQDKAGGVTQRVPLSLIVSSIQGQNVFQPLDGDLTAIAAISGTGILTRTGTNAWAVASSVTPSAHASSHYGSDALSGQSIPGLLPTNSPTWASVQLKGSGNSDLGFLSSAGSLRYIVRGDDTGDKWYVLTRNDDGSPRSERLRVPRSDASPVLVNLGLNVSSGALQLGGVDAITSTREGRFTGMRLTNLSAGQMPVASDGNGQITASGETDDGTYFSSNRILRLWNTLTKTGDTWTAFQWTQDAQERVSMFSSNGSGAGAYPTLAVSHADNEAVDRVLGFQVWCQKVVGKTGTNPGIKIDMSGTSVGSGGSIGGFGGRWDLRYRPDNGPNMTTALRVGAFGGGTADAVETAILLRATAGIDSLGMRWTSYGGRIGILPSSSNPALGFGFSIDSTGDVEINPPNEARIKAGGVQVISASDGLVDIAGNLSARIGTLLGQKVANDTEAYAQVEVSGPGGTGRIRAVNDSAGSLLGINEGALEISSDYMIAIGVIGGASVVFNEENVELSDVRFNQEIRHTAAKKNASDTTASGESLVVFYGTSAATETLPLATGSGRVVNYSHSGSPGAWTLSRNGSDVIVDIQSTPSTSVTITSGSSIKYRRYYDYAPGTWISI